MQTILVATDFTEASHNACLYAAGLARAFKARLILFSAYQGVPVPVTEGLVIDTPEDMKDFVQQRLEDEALAVNPANHIVIERYCSDGPPAGAILRMARLKQCDLILAGMMGSGSKIRKFLGSTVTALARKTSIPLLVIPEGVKFAGLSSLALATEKDIGSDADTRAFDILRQIGECFNPGLYLVRIARNRFHETYESLNRPFYLSRMVKTMDPQYECIEAKNIPGALNEFIQLHQIDMLILLPHEHTLLDKWIVKSISRSMVFQAKIPVLLLPHLVGQHR